MFRIRSHHITHDKSVRSGSTLLIVVALMGMMAFLGFVFYTFAAQERAQQSERHGAPGLDQFLWRAVAFALCRGRVDGLCDPSLWPACTDFGGRRSDHSRHRFVPHLRLVAACTRCGSSQRDPIFGALVECAHGLVDLGRTTGHASLGGGDVDLAWHLLGHPALSSSHRLMRPLPVHWQSARACAAPPGRDRGPASPTARPDVRPMSLGRGLF